MTVDVPVTNLGRFLDITRPLTSSHRRYRLDETVTGRATVHARVNRSDYQQWLRHVESVGGCVRPIRLTGHLHTIDTTTGRILATRSTHTLPDGVIYIPCGDRRASVCPSCAELYRADTYQMIKAGLVGGKGIPESIADHPAVFTTLTAPSFGPVHTRTLTPNGTVKPCHPRRSATLCPHGRLLACMQRHDEHSRCLGTPLCPDCYDYPAHAVWNLYAPELWRRTTITLRRLVTQLGKQHGITLGVSFGKVAEYQNRGIVHFHAVIRLDRLDNQDPNLLLPPPPNITAVHLDELITQAVAATAFCTPPHPGNHTFPTNPDGWLITWGHQLENRPLTRIGHGAITEQMVAAYVAKYATKATEITGHTSRRLTTHTISHYANPDTHTGRLIDTCWNLGGNPHPPDTPQRDHFTHTYGRLRKWAHMFGFGGHFATQSRRYGPTRTTLKTIRRIWRHTHQKARAIHRTAEHLDNETTLIVGQLTYAGTGWHTTGDAILASNAAARAREQRQTTKQERFSRMAS